MEGKNTGLFHDDDGNIDDRRVAAWVLFVVLLVLAWIGVHKESNVAVELISILVWPDLILFGITVTEKLRGALK